MYANFGARKTEIIRNIAVLGTVSGPNFVNSAQVPEYVVIRKIKMDLNILYSNGYLLKISGMIFLILFLGNFVIKSDLFVYERLEDQDILGGAFFDHFAESIRPR